MMKNAVTRKKNEQKITSIHHNDKKHFPISFSSFVERFLLLFFSGSTGTTTRQLAKRAAVPKRSDAGCQICLLKQRVETKIRTHTKKTLANSQNLSYLSASLSFEECQNERWPLSLESGFGRNR